MLKFYEVEKTEDSYLEKKYPYKVHYENTTPNRRHNNSVVKRVRYFESRQKAEHWQKWATDVVAKGIPLGITLELRTSTNPFLARVGKHSKYFPDIESALDWIAKERAARDRKEDREWLEQRRNT